VATTIASICYNTKSFINFYVLDGGIGDFNKKQIEALEEKFKNFSIEFIDTTSKKVFENFKTTSYQTIVAYYRFLIPNLKPNVDRAIYLDVDTIIFSDIAELYGEDLENYSLGAVYDVFVNENKKKFRSIKTKLQLAEDHKYFNSGVLLIDCKKWRTDNTIEGLLETEKLYRGLLTYNDQDVLNKYFSENYKLLDIKYNYVTGYVSYCKSHGNEKCEYFRKKIVVRHFNSQLKPDTIENYDYCPENFVDFWKFAKMTLFYEEMHVNLELSSLGLINKTKSKIYMIKLFNLVPILKIEFKCNFMKVKLFDYIPLFKIKRGIK
jgi:lipopolysaccharide biosynthesis glycosyltransferase